MPLLILLLLIGLPLAEISVFIEVGDEIGAGNTILLTVATAVGGMPEVIDDEDTGLLVPYGDTQKLAERLDLVLQDASLREHLCRNALLKARAEYHESAYKARICQIVSEASGRRPVASGDRAAS